MIGWISQYECGILGYNAMHPGTRAPIYQTRGAQVWAYGGT